MWSGALQTVPCTYASGMSDVVLAALFAAGGAALVAVAGAFAQILGPAWADGRRAKREADAAREALRSARALEWVSTMVNFSVIGADTRDMRPEIAARGAFLATLRPGESAVAKFVEDSQAAVEMYRNEPGRGQAYMEAASEQLFAWLRGDLAASELSEAEASTKAIEAFTRRLR